MTQDKILDFLEKNKDSIVTGGSISKELGISRTAVWKSIHSLKENGHDIETLSNSGYRLSGSNDGLSPVIIDKYLDTLFLGRSIELRKSLDSTNTYLKSLDMNNLEEGFTVIAENQTGGRGRLGRTFVSAPGEGVYFSFLLKPVFTINDIPLLTVSAAVAVCRALKSVCGIEAAIKWVNDVFVDGKKICGILTEASVSAELNIIENVVVGIGINTGEVPEAIEEIATSVLKACGMRGIRSRLIAEVLNEFEALYKRLTSGDRESITTEYSDLLFIKGKKVSAKYNGTNIIATAVGIDTTGSLILIGEDGRVIVINSGEIKLL